MIKHKTSVRRKTSFGGREFPVSPSRREHVNTATHSRFYQMVVRVGRSLNGGRVRFDVKTTTGRLQQYYLASILSIDVSDALAVPAPYDRTKCLISTCKGPRWRVMVYPFLGGQRPYRNIQTFVSIVRNDFFLTVVASSLGFIVENIILVFVYRNARVHVSTRHNKTCTVNGFRQRELAFFPKKKVCKSKE